MDIKISLHSQKLIKRYLFALGVKRHEINLADHITLTTMISWLNVHLSKSSKNSQQNQKIEFISVSLQAALLQDLYHSMQGDTDKIKTKNIHPSRMSKIKFFLLTAAGILVTVCQGFDGIVTLLSVFSVAPSIMLGVGFAFILLSLIVFLGVDLVKVSNFLGVQLSEYKLLDAYLLQLQNIKAIRKKINSYILVDMSQQELLHLKQILSLLQNNFLLLTKASLQFDEALNNKNIQLIKMLFSGVSALSFFGGGFFAGQSVGCFVASIFLSSVTATFFPIVIFSAIVGLAALSIYWYIERPGLEKLVNNWFGLDEEKVQQLCSKALLSKEAKYLANLKEKVLHTTKLCKRFESLANEINVSQTLPIPKVSQCKSRSEVRLSTNFYSFLKSPVLETIITNDNQSLKPIIS